MNLGIMHKRRARCQECGKKAPIRPITLYFKPKLRYFWFIVNDALWDQVTGTTDGVGMLCIRCFREKLGRDMDASDFSRRMRINSFDTPRDKYDRFNDWRPEVLAAYANGDDTALDGTSHEGKC